MYTTISSVIVLVIAFFTVCSSQFILSECLKNKACIFISANCEEKGDCEKIISYALEPDDWVVVELFYNTTHPDTNYAAIGFSKDTQMGDEGVTHCGLGEMNQAGNAAKYVELLEASHTSGSIYCKFRQKVAPDETAQKARVPDLNRTYYLLLAYGKTNKYEELDIHSLDERSKDFPLFISTPVNVAAWERAPLAPVKPRTNRILMLVGWMWLIPSAIAAARYLREYWPETRPFGLKIWFHIHRTTNYLAIILIIIGVLSVFVGKEWRWTGPAVSKTIQRNLSAGAIHSIIGAITVGVMLIQPVGALLRCDEGSKSRIVFNWSHRIFGFLSFLLGRNVIFFRLWVARWAAIVLYVLYVILIALLFFLIKKTNPLKGQQNISVTYAGRHYHQEQIVITEAKYDNKVNQQINSTNYTGIHCTERANYYYYDGTNVSFNVNDVPRIDAPHLLEHILYYAEKEILPTRTFMKS
uniref:Cytochrome b561 domain-containing protein n=1 Tax=Wuchereria bancrofti TaxID=6293 RepID=A0A1I8ECE9_WUCBA